MYCRICGSEDDSVKYCERQRNTLCKYCRKGMPAKLSRAAFDLAYWGKDFEQVQESTRREFYADYKTSTDTLAAYKAATITQL